MSIPECIAVSIFILEGDQSRNVIVCFPGDNHTMAVYSGVKNTGINRWYAALGSDRKWMGH